MQQFVVLEVGVLTEAPVAHVTAVRPGTTMDVHVAAKVPGGWK